MAEADHAGLVKTLDLPGNVAVMVRYSGKVAVSGISIPLGAPVGEVPPSKNFIDDLVFALVTFADGSVFDLVVSYSLPPNFPIAGLATRFELLGDAGYLQVAEDHGDQILATEHGYDNAYVDQHLDLAYLGSRTSGEWAHDTMFGRVADETRAWLDHLSTGAPCHITTGREARAVLELTIAIQDAARSGRTINLQKGTNQ